MHDKTSKRERLKKATQKEASKQNWDKHLGRIRIGVLYVLFGVFAVVMIDAALPERLQWLAQGGVLRKVSDNIIPTFIGILIAMTFSQFLKR